jgi:hypothetical protein
MRPHLLLYGADVIDWPQYQPMPLVAVQRFLGEKQQFHRGRAPREIHLNLCARRILEARERLGRISRIPDGTQ